MKIRKSPKPLGVGPWGSVTANSNVMFYREKSRTGVQLQLKYVTSSSEPQLAAQLYKQDDLHIQ